MIRGDDHRIKSGKAQVSRKDRFLLPIALYPLARCFRTPTVKQEK